MRYVRVAVIWMMAFNAQARPLTIFLDWMLNTHHAPLIIAQVTGAFERRGLEVTLVRTGGTEEAIRYMAAGRGDMAVSAMHRHIFHVAKGLPVVHVATLIAKPLEVCLVREGFTDPASWAGQRIGFIGSRSGITSLIIQNALQAGGLLEKDVTLVACRQGLPSAFAQNHVSIAFDLWITDEAAPLKAVRPDTRYLPLSTFGVPDFAQIILVVHKDRRDNPEWEDVLDALDEATYFIKTSPHEAWKLLIKTYPELRLYEDSWEDLVEVFCLTSRTIKRAQYERLLAFLEPLTGFPPSEDLLYQCARLNSFEN